MSSLMGVEASIEQFKEILQRMEARLRAPRPTLYSVVDAAKLVGVGLTTMKELIRSGEILTATVGKRRMVPLSELERLATPDVRRPTRAQVEDDAAAARWVPIPKGRRGRAA